MKLWQKYFFSQNSFLFLNRHFYPRCSKFLMQYLGDIIVSIIIWCEPLHFFFLKSTSEVDIPINPMPKLKEKEKENPNSWVRPHRKPFLLLLTKSKKGEHYYHKNPRRTPAYFRWLHHHSDDFSCLQYGVLTHTRNNK